MTTETTAPDGQSLEQDAAEHEHHHGYIGDKKAYLRRMSRIEGQARGIPDEAGPVSLVRAEAEGDDAIVAEIERRVAGEESVVAVTSDRGLRERADHAGAAHIRSAGWLLELLDAQG